jgi:hypothetical protein
MQGSMSGFNLKPRTKVKHQELSDQACRNVCFQWIMLTVLGMSGHLQAINRSYGAADRSDAVFRGRRFDILILSFGASLTHRRHIASIGD